MGLVFAHLLLISIQVPRGDEPSYFERTFFTIFTPVQHGIVSFFGGLKDFGKNYLYFRDLRRQNRILENEVFALRQENLALKNLLSNFRGAEEIRELLSTLSRSVVVATVIAFDPSQIYSSIELNKGAADGVRRDMAVLDRKAHLVGRVVEPISRKRARVQLITDGDSGVGVCTERFRVLGTLQGDGRGRCNLKYIFKTNRDVEVNEEIRTSGLDGVYPSGIPVGRILSIDARETDLFKTIVVEPYFDLSDLGQVAVFTIDRRDLD